MLHKILPDGGGVNNMHVPNFPIMTRFLTEIIFPEDDEQEKGGRVVVTYDPPTEENGDRKTLEIPLHPDVEGLEIMDIDLQKSPTKAYNMGETYNAWFSSRFGFDVILSYLGSNNQRRVLGNFNPNTTDASASAEAEAQQNSGSGWLSSITKQIPSLGYIGGASKEEEEIPTGLTFADLAAYLIVSETSRQDVSSRLPEGEEMDITKFRPNIVISGPQTAFEEDFWAELKIGGGTDDDASLVLTANCPRCVSINIDFETGKAGTGESGKVLKKLMKDRRVDAGDKYGAIFGRYAFLGKSCPRDVQVAIGDKVEVTKRNDEHTKLCRFLDVV